MATTETPAPAEPRHGLRLFAIWIVLALAADLVIWFVWKPHLPPGAMSDAARHQQFDIAVMAVSGAPVVIFVLLYFVYSIVVFRARPGDDGDGEPIYGNTKVQLSWIIGTTVIVMWLFVFGTVELVAWTYRYPQFGGMESSELMLPVDTPVTFHVTSLDVIHSFWAYQLGVKADANPQVDNVAYVTPKSLGSVTVRCNELCGIWHGAMFNYGHVVTQSAFESWASGVQTKEQSAGVLAALPAYTLTYEPTVIPQLGQSMVKIDQITGAAGYYYPAEDPEQP